MKMGIRLLGVLVILAGSGPAIAGKVKDFFPISQGRSWQYQVNKTRTLVLPDRQVSSKAEGISVERVGGVLEDPQLGAPVFLLEAKISETDLDSGETVELSTVTHLSTKNNELLMHAQQIKGMPGRDSKLERYDPPVVLLRFPLPKEGEPYPGTIKSQGLTIDLRPFAKGKETIETAAGIFRNCLRISSRGPVSGTLPGPQPLPLSDGSIEETSWFSKGVGLVKQHQVLRLMVDLGSGNRLELTDEKMKLLTKYEKKASD